MIRVLLVLFALTATAEERPLLVRDLPGVETVDSFSNGTFIWTTIGNTTWFTAWTGVTTTDVFKTDGTTAGTVRMTFNADPQSYLGSIGGKLVYAANDDVYALDENGGPPVLLTGAEAQANGVVLDGVLYFVAQAGAESELWRTDGTPGRTFKVDLLSGAQGAFDSALQEDRLFVMGGAIYFFGVTVSGTGLHRTLGTPQSTTLVTPLDGIGIIANVYESGERLYFHAASRVWGTDGTPGGTAILLETFSFELFAEFGGKLLFTTDRNSIWSTDGTAAGTRETDIYRTTGTESVYPGEVLGDKLFFFVGEFGRTSLYVTGGTGATTKAIAGVERGSGYGDFVIGDRYYFPNETAAHGVELWVTDGTTAQLFVDINPGPRSSLSLAKPGERRPDGTVLFSAEHVDFGIEPWITDGTPAGTRLLANLAPDTRTFSSAPHLLRATGRRVFFTARVTRGDWGIGVSDGTSAGTAVTPITPGSSFPAVSNGRYFFSSNGQFSAFDGTTVTWLGHGTTTGYAVAGGVVFIGDDDDLWFSDGTASGTRHILDLPSTEISMFSLGNEVWLDSGSRTWITDGTPAGTRELVLPPPRGPMNGVIRSGTRYFFFTDGSRLWRSDGTSAGTQVVKQTASGPFLGANAQYAYYATGTIGRLSRTDGTDAGTVELPLTSIRCAEAAFVGDVLIVRAVMPQGVQLWRSDGTVAGTTRLATFASFEPCLFSQSDIEARGGLVYLRGFDAAHGWEPWVTDGTVAGTRMLVDLYPGGTGSEPGEFTVAEDVLFFTATTPGIGNELWAVGARAAVPRRRAVGPR